MKKTLIFLLIAVISISSISFTYAETDKEGDMPVDEARLLNVLGIMETPDSAKYGEYISREDFAYSTAKLMGLSGASQNRYYTDVSSSSYAYAYINDLVEAKVLTPASDGSFNPFDIITFDEAYKILVAALGYSPVAEASGGYPVGYARIANRLDISIVGTDTRVKVADAVQMMYNTLKSCYYDVEAIQYYDEEVGVSYYDSDECYAKAVFGLEVKEGTVYATPYGNAKSPEVLDEYTILADDVIYDIAADVETEGLLGSYTEFFCTDDDTPEIVYIRELNNNKQVVDIEDYISYDTGGIKYVKDGEKTASISLPQQHTIVYNGMPLRSKIRETMTNLNKGSITLKDSDGDNTYDIIDIRDYENFYVTVVDGDKLFNEFVVGEYIDFAAAKSYNIKKDGSKIFKEDIVSETSISVARSQNNEILEIIINSTTVSGTVSRISEDKVTVDDKEYAVDKSYLKELAENVNIGGYYKFSIDFKGNISYAKADTKRRMTLGYIIDYNESGVFEQSISILIMNGDGEKNIYETAKNIKIDAVKYKSSETDKIVNALKNGKNHARQLIQFEVDDDGKLCEIDTVVKNPGEDPNYSLTRAFETVESRWYHNQRYGFTAICSNTDTIAFCIPSSGTTDEDKYYTGKGVATITDSHDCYWALDCYYAGENSPIVDAVIGEMNIDDYEPNTVVMVDEISTVLNADGELMHRIEGYFMGKKDVYNLADDIEGVDKLNEVRRGDLIIFEENQAKEISKVRKVFDGQTRTPIGWEYETEKELLLVDGFKEHYCEQLNLSFGYVRKNYGGVISISKTPTSVISERIWTDRRLNMLYDAESDTIELVKDDRITDYETVGDNCMIAIHYMWYEEGRGVYLYN